MSSVGDKTRNDLGWPTLCRGWADRCHTKLAAERVLERTESLEFSPLSASLQRERIEEARALRDSEAALMFAGISDIRVALARAQKGGVLDPEELVAVARTTASCARLQKRIVEKTAETPSLGALAEGLHDHIGVYEPILYAFDDDGRLADHASESLGRLRKRVVQLVAQLDDKARHLLDDKRLHPHLQDRFYTQREDRYVIPVKVEARSQVPGIVHGTSQSGQTIFVEPQALVELNNKLKLAECEVTDEERRIYAELSGYVSLETREIRATIDVATEIDLVDGGALLAAALGASTPVVDGATELALKLARHPLMVLSDKMCVPNDIVIGKGRGLVISGPNAGGKTVALKTAGLAALMVRAGLPVAAEPGSCVPWFTSIDSDIGDSQSLEMDLSTFSARLLRLAEFLQTANRSSLLLVDEIAVGTEPEQGASLAQAVIEDLVNAGATVIATTHYERLKMLAGSDERFENASVGFDLDKLEPTFKLTLGTPGASGALRVARRLGLPEPVLERAHSLLGDSQATVDDLIDQLEQARGKLEAERVHAEELRHRAEDALAKARAKEENAADIERRARQGAHSEATAALQVARRELDAAKKQVRKRISVQALKQVEREVDKAARAVVENAPVPRDVGRPATASELVVGTPVYVASLGTHGTIAEPVQGKKVAVSIGSMRSTVRVKDLRVESKRAVKKAQKDSSRHHQQAQSHRVERASDGSEGLVRTAEATLDLRGERADAAIDELDRFLDRSLLADRDALFVIHGHGTGALKKAVRSHLKGHPSVSSYRKGELKEGGDGVTIAVLDV